MSHIADLKAIEIIDSRGNPTVMVHCVLDNGVISKACVPSGASTGKHEAVELRDGDKSRYLGKGVLKAVDNVNEVIAEKLIGVPAFEQRYIDNLMIELDGTSNKSKLGANAILGVSMAVTSASAESLGLPLWHYIGGMKTNTLPIPMMNFVNGGAHADSGIDIQEFMVIPAGAPDFSCAVRCCSEIFHTLKKILKERKLSISVGDEGGFAPKLPTAEEVLKVLNEATKEAGYLPGSNIFYALDSAASEFQKGDKYLYEGKEVTSEHMIDIYEKLIDQYNVISLEDPLGEDDWTGWKKLTERLGNKVQIVGDDLFVTNPDRFRRGIDEGIANAILIKLNQIGTVSETLRVIEMAKNNGYNTVISHRSGETEDTFIADFAVGTNACQIKTGSMSRSERIAKYNRLMIIEEQLGGFGKLASPESLYPNIKCVKFCIE